MIAIPTFRYRLQQEMDWRLPNPKTLRRSRRMYRCLYLQMDHFSRTFVVAYGSIHLGLVVLAIFCSYGSVRFHGLLAFGFAWMFTACLVMLVLLVLALAAVNRKSKATLESMQKVAKSLFVGLKGPQRRMLRREMSNMQGLKVRVGSMFYYDSPLLLTTLDVLLTNAVNLLLFK